MQCYILTLCGYNMVVNNMYAGYLVSYPVLSLWVRHAIRGDVSIVCIRLQLHILSLDLTVRNRWIIVLTCRAVDLGLFLVGCSCAVG